MTILSVVQQVAHKVGLNKPDAVFITTDRDMEEMQDLIHEATTDILECQDWQVLRIKETITGDGASEGHSFPVDYERMYTKSNFWSSRWIWAINHITDPDEWLEYEVIPYTFVTGNWMLFGGNINILPVMEATETIKYWYISNAIVSPASGSPKVAFTADDDYLRVKEKLLYLGLVWKWKAKKGQPYAEDMESYEDHKAYLIDKDGGSKPVLSGNRRNFRSRHVAFPQTVGS